ncbi:hypothetical protein [Bacillus xiapuensis]|uniref:hypothetical protein n=1 Tax=Bacillus xiapuensis TaxID=2014075 RepID=UPI003AF322CF
MHQYWYVNSKGNGQLYNNQVSVPPLYSQPQIPKPGGINVLGVPEDWSGRVYPASWEKLGGVKGFDRMEQPVNLTSPAGKMGLTAQEPSPSWTTSADYEGFTPHGHNGKSMPLVNHDDWESHEQPTNLLQLPEHPGFMSQGHNGNWLPPIDHDDWESQEQPTNLLQLPEHPGFMSQGHNGNWLPPVDHDDWESQEQSANWPQLPEHLGFALQGQPTLWMQPISHAGMISQGQPLGWAPSAGHVGFNSQKQPFPWEQPVNHAGMFAQGHLAALVPPFANPFGFSASGQQANWGGFGNPVVWGGQVNHMGWGAPIGWVNNNGNGQPGILGGLIKVGKGTMNGIGIISSLIGVGKFLF